MCESLELWTYLIATLPDLAANWRSRSELWHCGRRLVRQNGLFETQFFQFVNHSTRLGEKNYWLSIRDHDDISFGKSKTLAFPRSEKSIWGEYKNNICKYLGIISTLVPFAWMLRQVGTLYFRFHLPLLRMDCFSIAETNVRHIWCRGRVEK